MWTLSCALILEIHSDSRMHASSVEHLRHSVDNKGRYREETQVSQIIIRSPSALSVQQPASSRALKSSLISSERTADT